MDYIRYSQGQIIYVIVVSVHSHKYNQISKEEGSIDFKANSSSITPFTMLESSTTPNLVEQSLAKGMIDPPRQEETTRLTTTIIVPKLLPTVIKIV